MSGCPFPFPSLLTLLRAVLQLCLYLTRSIPILFFHVYLLWRFYDLQKKELDFLYSHNLSQSTVLMVDDT